MGLFRFDHFATYLSDQIVNAFTVGVAFHIFTAQLPTSLGLFASSDSRPLSIFRVNLIDINSFTVEYFS